MQVDEVRWQRLRAAQADVVSREQALACGWTSSAIAHRCGSGMWRVLVPGVLLLTGGEASERQRWHAALLHAGPGAALTGATACQVHGLERAPARTVVAVAVPAVRGVRSAAFISVQPTTRALQTVVREGVAVVGVPRAVVDAALGMPRINDVRALVAEAVQRGRCTVTDVERELRRAPVRGSRNLREALSEVGAGARSAPEAVLLAAFRRRRDLPPYELNVDVRDWNGHWLARPDVVFRRQQLIVEVDGRRWHLSPDAWAADVERHTRLEAAGWTVLRYTAARVLASPDAVAAEIAEVLARRTAA